MRGPWVKTLRGGVILFEPEILSLGGFARGGLAGLISFSFYTRPSPYGFGT
jgi:hypothetical protein